MISSKEFEEFCLIAKKHGVKTLTAEGLSITFAEETSPIIHTTNGNHISSEVMPTEDQFLLWSTDSMPDRKELKND